MAKIDRHSRIVGWLKVALPLTALALLSTLFLLADRVDPSAAIRYAQVDVEALARDPRMTAPSYAGTTSDGAALTLTAAAARPASAARVAAAEDVTLRLDMPGGGHTDITAQEAEIDTAAGQLRLSGEVEIAASSGYRIETEKLEALLDRSQMASRSPVTATGPGVKIEADRFILNQGGPVPGAPPGYVAPEPNQPAVDAPTAGAEAGSVDPVEKTAQSGPAPYLLVFSGGVRMVYQPGG